jgi:type IV pilus assembly protein PilM
MNSWELCISAQNNTYKFILGRYDEKLNKILVSKHFEIQIPQEFDIYNENNRAGIAGLIKTALKKNGVKTHKYKICLSDKNIINRVINLPKMDIKDLESFMKLSISQYFPISSNDYYFDYRIQSINKNDEKSYYNLFLAAIPKFIVKAHANILLSCGLKPRLTTIFSDCMVRLFSNYIKDFIMLVDIGYGHTEIIVLEDNTIFINSIVDFSLPKIGENIDKDNYLKNLSQKDLGEEFDLVLENIDNYIKFFSSRHHGQTIGQIYFTSEGARLEKVIKEAKESLDINITSSKELFLDNKISHLGLDKFEPERYNCCIGLILEGK